jgi:hypothetical protein
MNWLFIAVCLLSFGSVSECRFGLQSVLGNLPARAESVGLRVVGFPVEQTGLCRFNSTAQIFKTFAGFHRLEYLLPDKTVQNATKNDTKNGSTRHGKITAQNSGSLAGGSTAIRHHSKT